MVFEFFSLLDCLQLYREATVLLPSHVKKLQLSIILILKQLYNLMILFRNPEIVFIW